MEELINLISNVGFPIAVCIYMIVKQTPAINAMKESLDNNTFMMEKIVDRLDHKE